jgi:hypothetical protein
MFLRVSFTPRAVVETHNRTGQKIVEQRLSIERVRFAASQRNEAPRLAHRLSSIETNQKNGEDLV